MMVKLKAKKSFRFDGRHHSEGDTLETTDTFARVLEARGNAEREKSAKVEKTEIPAPPRTRGRYARRDMVSEEHADVAASPLHSAMTTSSASAISTAVPTETSDEDKTS